MIQTHWPSIVFESLDKVNVDIKMESWHEPTGDLVREVPQQIDQVEFKLSITVKRE